MKLKKSFLIVGAGPAGLSTAIILRKMGIECCVIDENASPRNKACGGLLTAKTLTLLQYILDDISSIYTICKKLNKVYVTYVQRKSFSFMCNTDFYVTNRLLFDNLLISAFKNSGGEIIEKCTCQKIDSEYKIIETTQGSFTYDKLIIAVGANGIKKINGLTTISEPLGFGSVEIINDLDLADDGIHLDIGNVPYGYSWAFPQKDGGFNVGIAGLTANADICRRAYAFVESKYGFDRAKAIYDNIPIRRRPHTECKSDMHIIGSANNLIDSMTGEGIFFALYSGIALGLYLSETISKKEYLHLLKVISFFVKGGTFSSSLLWKYNTLTLIARIAPYLKKLDTHVCDNLISNYRYNHYTALLSPINCYFRNTPNKPDQLLNALGVDLYVE